MQSELQEWIITVRNDIKLPSTICRLQAELLFKLPSITTMQLESQEWIEYATKPIVRDDYKLHRLTTDYSHAIEIAGVGLHSINHNSPELT